MFKLLGLCFIISILLTFMMVYGMVAVNAMLTHGWDGRPWVANFGVMLLILIALVGTSIGLGMVIVREFGEKNENIT